MGIDKGADQISVSHALDMDELRQGSLILFIFLLATSCRFPLLEDLHARLECRNKTPKYGYRTRILKYEDHPRTSHFDSWSGADWLGWLSQRRLQRWANLFEVLRTYSIELLSRPE